MLVRAGVVLLTEKGFSATCVDDVLNATGISKGSFYYCFSSKEDFGRALIESYATYFNEKLDRWLTDPTAPPLQRLLNFMREAKAGMQRHAFRRGCLIGNLGQEIDILPESFNKLLRTILQGWERRVTDCLLTTCGPSPTAAQETLCSGLSRYFWMGWEGAVLRARMEHGPESLDLFATFYLTQAAVELGVTSPLSMGSATTPRGSHAPPARAKTGQEAG